MITIEEARKKLGKKGEKMTDKEVDRMVVWLTAFCEKIIDETVNKKVISNGHFNF